MAWYVERIGGIKRGMAAAQLATPASEGIAFLSKSRRAWGLTAGVSAMPHKRSHWGTDTFIDALKTIEPQADKRNKRGGRYGIGPSDGGDVT